ncbi:sushi domain-containing protein 5 [Cololabis saira]|uniref:sushi domain-containing protein 5 n=1 Tax=Cololabis saira TaxID=129043 RepID=UPI002AD30CE4|nr:sushi domain-containing protein 5 [Cololabis saira]
MVNSLSQTVLSLLFGCLTCLLVTSVVDADGRVFVLDLRNSSGATDFRDAEQACAAHRAHLASEEELFHAVVECFVSQCTRGWLYGGTVGTTVCNMVSGSVKAVDVRTENATEDTGHLAAFCIKDKDMPCGDPPSFPSVRLQDHSGFEMGDELLYTCVPGYVMQSGHSAFSLLCDSCGEWYGRVQMCVKDEAESHIDYEDMHTDSYEEADQDHGSPEEAHEEVYEEEYGGAHQDGKKNLNQQVLGATDEVDEDHQDQREEDDLVEKVIDNSREFEGAKSQEQSHEDFTDHPSLEQDRSGAVRTDATAATEEPVSHLSQKHLFWFPSEAFQEEGTPIATVSATHTTQRASGAHSEESKEHDSHEGSQQPQPVDADDHDDDPDDDREDHGDHDDDKDDRDTHDDDHYDDKDDTDSHQEEDHDGHDNPDQHKDPDDHDDHYDMGEHEEDRDRVYYGNRENDDRDDSYDDHQSFEDHDDAVDDHTDDEREHLDGSEEHPDHDDHEDGDEHPDFEDDSHNDDHKDDYDDPDSHEDDDGHVFVAAGGGQNVTQSGAEDKAKDETWLDGYPVVLEENSESTTEDVAKTPDRRNDVEIRRPVPSTGSPDEHESPPGEPESDGGVVEKVWPGFTGTPAASPEYFQPSDSPSYLDTLDYDTQQAAPTHSWLDDLTEHPFLDHGPAPPVHDGDVFGGEMGEHTAHNLPNETGEMGDVEGEMGEATCVGEDCPPQPPSSSGRGPKVAAIIVAVCAIATAVIVGLWCYRRQQQRTSVYEMNGKGQSQSRQGQQIEMQQKV